MKPIGIALKDAGIILAILVTTGVGLKAYFSISNAGADPAQSPQATASTESQPNHEAELALVGIARKYRSLYDAVPFSNEVKRTLVFDNRGHNLCSYVNTNGQPMNAWTGTISSMDTSSSGSVDLEIQISPHVSVESANDIQNQSPLFMKLANLNVGSNVTFSGALATKSGRSCIVENSITEAGSMDDPEFSANIVDVSAAQ